MTRVKTGSYFSFDSGSLPSLSWVSVYQWVLRLGSDLNSSRRDNQTPKHRF